MVGSVEFFIKAPSKYDGQIGLRLYTGGTKSAVPVLYQHESITKPDGSVGIVCTMEFVVYDTQGNLLPNTFWGTRGGGIQVGRPVPIEHQSLLAHKAPVKRHTHYF